MVGHEQGIETYRKHTEAMSYWQRLCTQDGIPAYSWFDPSEIPGILPHLMVLDVISEPLDFRYRLMGEKVRALQRQSLTGWRVSELPDGAAGKRLMSSRKRVVETGEPGYAAVDLTGWDGLRRRQVCLHLPFAGKDGQISVLIAVIVFEHTGAVDIPPRDVRPAAR